MKCESCKKKVEAEREELGFSVCLKCAKAGIAQPEDIRGMVEDIECGEIKILTSSQYERVIAYDIEKANNS